jgi:N-formylglutamate amidohydrolase
VFVPLLAADEPAAPVSNLVATQNGEIPIILSAPHGGTKEVPGVPPRQGKGMKKGGAGFFAGRDVGTEELAYALADAVKKKTGKKPYYVVAKFHRKYIDANRPPEIAYESPKAKSVYDSYRRTLAKYCLEVKKIHGRGLLLDVHGQGAIKDSVIRGTKDGKTVSLLVQRAGVKAHTGPKSFFGLLAGQGFKVYPVNLSDKEYPTLNGGNIVQTYGGEKYGIDAIQIEFGSVYRAADKRKEVAANTAAAVAEFAKLYLAERK